MECITQKIIELFIRHKAVTGGDHAALAMNARFLCGFFQAVSHGGIAGQIGRSLIAVREFLAHFSPGDHTQRGSGSGHVHIILHTAFGHSQIAQAKALAQAAAHTGVYDHFHIVAADHDLCAAGSVHLAHAADSAHHRAAVQLAGNKFNVADGFTGFVFQAVQQGGQLKPQSRKNTDHVLFLL